LAAVHPDVEEMCQFIQADTLGFISAEGLYKVMPKTVGYCNACFTGEYPEGQKPARVFKKEILETR
jgi:amidophosphoribosyltransferase